MAPQGKRYTKDQQVAEFRTTATPDNTDYPVAPYPYPVLAEEQDDLENLILNNMQIKYRNTHQEGIKVVDVPAAEAEVAQAYACFKGDDETQMFKNADKSADFEDQVNYVTDFQYEDPSVVGKSGEYTHQLGKGKNKTRSVVEFYIKGSQALPAHGNVGDAAQYAAAIATNVASPMTTLTNAVTYDPTANGADKFKYAETTVLANEFVTDYLVKRADQEQGTINGKTDPAVPNKREADAAKAQLDCIVRTAAYISAKYQFDTWVIRQVLKTHPEVESDGTVNHDVSGPRGVVDEDGWGHWALQAPKGGATVKPYWSCAPIPAGMVSFLTTDGREVYAAENVNDENTRAKDANTWAYVAIQHPSVVKGNSAEDFMPIRDADLEFANNYQAQKTTKPRLPLMFGSDVPFGKKWEANKAATLAYRPTAVDENVAGNDYYGDYSFGYDLADYSYGYGGYSADYSYGYGGYSGDYSGDYDYDYDF